MRRRCALRREDVPASDVYAMGATALMIGLMRGGRRLVTTVAKMGAMTPTGLLDAPNDVRAEGADPVDERAEPASGRETKV
jgi:hypothetical protein